MTINVSKSIDSGIYPSRYSQILLRKEKFPFENVSKDNRASSKIDEASGLK